MPTTDAPRPRGWYEAFGRRAFFALDPERSHRVALATTVAGVPLANPIGLASGFDKACERFAPLGALGFGYVVGGTVTLRPRTGNPKPRIARDPARRAIVNAMGLPNPGAHAVAASLAKRPRTTSRWVSLADEDVTDACAALELLAPLADAIELNASSPNAGWTHRADHVGALVAAMRPRTDTPLFVKVPPFAAEQEQAGVVAIVEAAQQAGAHGITAGNTIPVADARMSTGRGGLSGAPLTLGTPQIVKTIREATAGAMPINACGGIFTGNDAQACLDAGAATVQVYTALIYEGPAVASRILAGLGPR